MAPIQLIHSAIAEAAAHAGFRKKGAAWHCSTAHAILVISPQKSQYSQKYFINIGIYWRSLGEKAAPKEQDCHVRGRIASALSTSKSEEVDRCLDFEDTSIPEEKRIGMLVEILSKEVIPLLELYSTDVGLREAIQNGKLRRFLIAKTLTAAMSK